MKTSTNPNTSKLGRIPKNSVLTLVTLLALPAFAVKAANIEWAGGTADYTNAVDWVGGVVPGSGDSPINSNGSNNVVIISAGDPAWTVGDLSAGGDTGSSGAIEQDGQTVNVTGWLHIGSGTNSFGVYTLDGGILNVANSANQLFLGEGPFSASILNINGGVLNSAATFHIADGNWNGAGARSATVNQTNGVVNSSGQIWIGEVPGATAVYNLSGGTINSSNWFVVSRAGASGALNMTGGVINQLPSNGDQPAFIVSDSAGAAAGTAIFNFSGGLINCQAEYWIGNNATAEIGTNNISGTATLDVNNWIAIGRGGNGTLNLNGGSITKTGAGNITIAGNGTSSTVGTVNQYAGFVTNTTSQTWIGESGVGVWNMEGGSAFLGQVVVCEDGSANGTLNLDGGLFQATGISTGSSVAFSTLSFNGATLQAGANNANFMSGLLQATVNAGGAVIDSQGYNITIGQTLQDGGGGLTKNGTGTLSLTGANSYSGDTVVNAGTLIIGTSTGASGNYTVADNDGFGVIVQSFGAQANASKNVTLGTSSGASLNFDMGGFGNAPSAPLNVAGVFTIHGTITVNVGDLLPTLGQFPLVQFATLAGAGNFVIGSLPTGVVGNVVTNGSTIALNLTTVNLPRWDGEAGGTWDINQTTNWVDLGSGLPDYYGDGNAVVFNDSALGTTNVILAATVSPGSVIVTNNLLNYNFAGPGKISGPTGLTKSGGGSLTIVNPSGNSYTGPTIVSGGALVITNLANGGSASGIGASSANPTNLVLAGGTLRYSGPTVSVNRGYKLSASSTIDAEGNLALSGLAQATGGTLAKIGPATMTYAGVGTNIITTANVGGAYQVQNGTTVFDGSGGAQTNTVIGEMWVSSVPTSVASLIVTNTTLGISSWFALGRGNGNSNFLSTASVYNSFLNVSYGNTGSTGAGNGGGVSLGYANSLPNAAAQTLNLSGNSSLINLGGNFNLAESTGSSALVNVTNSASITSVYARTLVGDTTGRAVMNLNSTATNTMCTTSGQVFLGGFGGTGDTGAGALNQTAGTLKFGNGSGVYIYLGDGGGSGSTAYGSCVLSGGTISETSGDGLRVGYGALGSFMQSGGTLLMGRYLSIGGNVASGNGVATFTGGTASIYNTTYRILLPDAGNATGVMNMGTEAGGTAIFTNLYNSGGASLIMENSSGGNGTLNLDSGTVQLGGAIHRSVSTGGSAIVNLNGGTVQAGANNITLIDTSLSSVNVFKGGLTVDTLTNIATVSGNLLTTFGNGIYPAGGSLIITTNGGAGYIGAPLVTVSGGSGSGAMAIATVSGGVLTNVVLTCPGQNYLAGDVMTFAFSGGGATTVASNFVYALQAADLTANSGGGLAKIGGGALYLTGGSTFTGATLVNAGTLAGTATISSPVAVAAGATLAVGSSPTTIGTFTVNNSVTLSAGSTNFMKVNKTGGTKDLLTGITQLNYGGTLVISNQAGTYAANDSFKLFNATTYNGAFSAIIPATPGTGLVWNTNQLTVSGTLLVASSVNTASTNLTFNVSGGNLNLSWPADHQGWRLQVQTNVAATGLSTNWVTWPNSTNLTSVSTPVNATNPAVFFRMVYP